MATPLKLNVKITQLLEDFRIISPGMVCPSCDGSDLWHEKEVKNPKGERFTFLYCYTCEWTGALPTGSMQFTNLKKDNAAIRAAISRHKGERSGNELANIRITTVTELDELIRRLERIRNKPNVYGKESQ